MSPVFMMNLFSYGFFTFTDYRAYIGITSHWICEETLKRRSAILTCKRIRGRQNYDILAENIDSTITSFKLNGHITNMVTDNGKNYIKAFKVYGESNADEEVDDNDEDEDVDDDDELFTPMEITDELNSLPGNNNSHVIMLPPHKRCAAHTFNLVMTTDANKFNDQNYNLLFNSMYDKCHEVFNKQSSSSKASDVIYSKIGRYFLIPVATRWNTKLNSLKLMSKLLETKENEIREIFKIFRITMFTDEEREILVEYVKVKSNFIKS